MQPKIRNSNYDYSVTLTKFEDVIINASEGGTPSTKIKSFYENGEIPFLTIDNMNCKYVNKHTIDKRITKLGLSKSSAWIVPVNSIIISTGATIGRVVINKSPTSTKQGILSIILKDHYDLEYMYYLFKSEVFKKELHKITTCGTMDCVYLKDIRNLFLPIEKTLNNQVKIGNFNKEALYAT